MQFNQFLYQGQADSGALVGSGTRVLDAVKTLENAPLLLFRDPDARVTNRKFHRTI